MVNLDPESNRLKPAIGPILMQLAIELKQSGMIPDSEEALC